MPKRVPPQHQLAGRSSNLVDLLCRIEEVVGLKDLNAKQLQDFITRASLLKREILQTQPSNLTTVIPEVLPPSVVEFLSESIDLPFNAVQSYWSVLKETVWAMPTPKDFRAEDKIAFKDYGWKRGLGAYNQLALHSY